jgi:hypothetical protein
MPDVVSPQIIDAVKTSTGFVFGPEPDPTAGTGVPAGNAIAYEKAAQAVALAVQDAADYQRNVLSISTVTQGKALAMMFATKEMSPYLEIFGLALVASLAASFTAGIASTEIAKGLKDFPPA